MTSAHFTPTRPRCTRAQASPELQRYHFSPRKVAAFTKLDIQRLKVEEFLMSTGCWPVRHESGCFLARAHCSQRAVS